MPTVLVVDDHRDICGAMIAMVQMCGYEAIGARDGLTALRTIQSDRPSLVILDQMMPGMDGLDVLKAIRADPTIKHVPVVMYSAAPSVEAKREAAALGVVDYLIKLEITPDRVAELVDRYTRAVPL